MNPSSEFRTQPGTAWVADRFVRWAPHALVWLVLLVPTIRSIARGWRPLSDDAGIAIQAWRVLSLHPPLLGASTAATAVKNASDPGPLEFWLLSPFVHLDPAQGLLVGSALLCAAILSVTLVLLYREVGPLASVLFSLGVADLAITSPTPFLDPAWNPSFGFFWFLAFLGVAFVVGTGNLRFLALLVFIGSVTIDSHLMYLPSVALVLVATGVTGWFVRRPPNFLWLWWSGGVAALCWFAPLGQEFFSSSPNLSLLVRSSGVVQNTHATTEGWVYGLRALSRAVSPYPIWATPRPTLPLVSAGDVGHQNLLLCLIVPLLIGIAVLAWRHAERELFSMCMVSLGGGLGVVLLYAHILDNYYASFVWVNMAVWVVGVTIWFTLGLALVVAIRSRQARNYAGSISIKLQVQMVLATLGVAAVAGLISIWLSYETAFVFDWHGVNRVEHMAAVIEHRIPKGKVNFAIRYKGDNPFQLSEDEHGVAYLLFTAGWIPGMEAAENHLLGMPIYPKSELVVFNEHGADLLSTDFYRRYIWYWSFIKP